MLNRNLAQYLDAFASSFATVSLDSCWVRQNAGRTNGVGGGPRRYTKATDAAAELLARRGSSKHQKELSNYLCLANVA